MDRSHSMIFQWRKSKAFFARLFSVVVIIISVNGATAQTISDFQTWYGASLKLDLKKGWTITTQYRARMIQNSSYYKGSYLYENIEYRVNDYLELSTNYRFAKVDVGTFHRFAFAAEGRYRFTKLTASFRPMIQYQHQHFGADDEFKTDNNTYLRTRLEFKYAISRRWEANIYAEPFYKLDKKTTVDWWQNSIGIKYEFSKGMKVNPYYIWQPDYSHKKYHVYHIIGLDFEFTIKV